MGEEPEREPEAPLQIKAQTMAVVCCTGLEKRIHKNQLARQGDDYHRIIVHCQIKSQFTLLSQYEAVSHYSCSSQFDLLLSE